MEKEAKFSTYNEATISKMLDMFTEVKEKIKQIVVLQDELAWMLYEGRQDSSVPPLIPAVKLVAEGLAKARGEGIKTKPASKLIKPTLDVKIDKKYSFCNSADTVLWHIRRMVDGGRTPTSTRSLCDEEVFWDEYFHLLVTEDNMDNVCMQCAVKFRREQGEQYDNKETDQHKQEG